MVNDSKSGNSLNEFVEKIDFTTLKGTPEDFCKAGLAFIENGQFDDSIQEFVKVVKTSSIDSPTFEQAVKELKSMGFSGADISAITSTSESEIDLKFEHLATPAVSNLPPQKNPFSNTFVKIFFGGWLIIFLGFVALTILSYLVEYLAYGNVGGGIRVYYIFFGSTAVIGTFLFYALVIYLVLYFIVSKIRSLKK